MIDEIGKMECLAVTFVRAARRALSGPVPVLGSVALVCGGFIAEAKRLPGVEVIQLARDDWDRLVAPVAERIRAATARGSADGGDPAGYPRPHRKSESGQVREVLHLDQARGVAAAQRF